MGLQTWKNVNTTRKKLMDDFGGNGG